MSYSEINLDTSTKNAAGTTTFTINTTAGSTLSVSIQWSAASASNTFTLQQSYFEKL